MALHQVFENNSCSGSDDIKTAIERKAIKRKRVDFISNPFMVFLKISKKENLSYNLFIGPALELIWETE